jgi:hypothetical protein
MLNSTNPPVVTLCSTPNSGFQCNTTTTFNSDGSGKIQPDNYDFSYTYVNGIYKINGSERELKVVSKNEFYVKSVVTQAGFMYENTFYKRK